MDAAADGVFWGVAEEKNRTHTSALIFDDLVARAVRAFPSAFLRIFRSSPGSPLVFATGILSCSACPCLLYKGRNST